MKVLYISCYPKSFLEDIKNRDIKSYPLGGQVFNSLLINGFKKNKCEVEVIVLYNPIFSLEKSIYKGFSDVVEDGIKYHFIPLLKVKYVGTFMTSIHLKRHIVKNYKKCSKSEIILVEDVLFPYKHVINKTFKKFSKNIVGIVTDLPSFFEIKTNNLLINMIKKKRESEAFKMINYFVLLTEAMKDKLDIGNRKYLIMEGLIDSQKYLNTSKVINHHHKIVLYSGDLTKLYGIMNLIEAFKKIDKSVELHLYGRCDYLDELNKIREEYPNIKYFGVMDNLEVINRQKNATILINPRPLNLEFNRYSFPSKTIEYMASGVPVLTTKLEGIPSEYNDYLYFTKGDSVNDIYEAIKELLSKNPAELIEKGRKAKKFVMENKNNDIQVKKVLKLIQDNSEV